MLKFHIKVFQISSLLNPVLDLNFIWYDDRYWFEILLSTIPTPGHDLQGRVIDFIILW